MKKTLMLGGALTATLAAAALAQMAPMGGMMMKPMTRAEVQAAVADHFKALDTNKDGVLTKDEIAAAREAKRDERRSEHRDAMFKMLDKDGNGSISKAEFDAAPPPGGPGPDGRGPDGMRGPGGPGGDHGMRHGGMHGHRGPGMGMMGGGRWFDQADANKDGKLTLAEAQGAALAMFDKADTNKDGKISPEEHKAAFEAMRAQWGKDRKPN